MNFADIVETAASKTGRFFCKAFNLVSGQAYKKSHGLGPAHFLVGEEAAARSGNHSVEMDHPDYFKRDPHDFSNTGGVALYAGMFTMAGTAFALAGNPDKGMVALALTAAVTVPPIVVGQICALYQVSDAKRKAEHKP